MKQHPKVSVCINTYNQETYIDRCLKGALEQECNFEYEILVHDDASTDGTRAIIDKYFLLYPTKIVPIFQSKNQYTINRHLPFINCWMQARGDYIAICEGDDYWIDPHKIQKQVDALSLSTSDICFTNALIEENGNQRKPYFKPSLESEKISLPKVVRSGGGGMPTASIMIKAEILQTLPKWFLAAPVGDMFIQILGAKRGGALYINDVTSVYTFESSGSWSKKRRSLSSQSILGEAAAYEQVFRCLKAEAGCSNDIDFATSREIFYLGVLAYKTRNFNAARDLIKKAKSFHTLNGWRMHAWNLIIELEKFNILRRL